MFNRGLRKEAQRNLEYEVENYNAVVEETEALAEQLYNTKCELMNNLSAAIDYINSLKNTPDEITVASQEIEVQCRQFEDLISDMEYNDMSDKVKSFFVGGIAGLFPELSPLLLGTGPLGLVAFGSLALFQSGKNKKAAEEINEQILEVKEALRKQQGLNTELTRVKKLLSGDSTGIRWMLANFSDYPTDYRFFNKDQRERLGAFKNCVKAIAYNLNKEIDDYGAFNFGVVDWKECGINPNPVF